MLRRLRRLWLVPALVAGVCAGGVAAPAAAADCTTPRVVGIATARVVEGTVRGGYTRLDFTVSTSGCTQPGSVRFQTVGDTAGKDDFVARTGELTYRSGDRAARTISIQVVADAVAEPTECLLLTLSPVGNVRADPSQAPGYIIDDDRKTGALPAGFICSE